jgi:hypothetical protein
VPTLHSGLLISGKKTRLVPFGHESGWDPGAIRKSWREKSLSGVGNRSLLPLVQLNIPTGPRETLAESGKWLRKNTLMKAATGAVEVFLEWNNDKPRFLFLRPVVRARCVMFHCILSCLPQALGKGAAISSERSTEPLFFRQCLCL